MRSAASDAAADGSFIAVDDNSDALIIAICTLLMKRVHRLFQHSAELVFVDASSMDRQNAHGCFCWGHILLPAVCHSSFSSCTSSNVPPSLPPWGCTWTCWMTGASEVVVRQDRLPSWRTTLLLSVVHYRMSFSSIVQFSIHLYSASTNVSNVLSWLHSAALCVPYPAGILEVPMGPQDWSEAVPPARTFNCSPSWRQCCLLHQKNSCIA